MFPDLCAYVDHIVAWPTPTDGRFWTLIALPSTGKSRELRLACVSCGWFETFDILEDPQAGDLRWFLNEEHGIVSSRSRPKDLRDTSLVRTIATSGSG